MFSLLFLTHFFNNSFNNSLHNLNASKESWQFSFVVSNSMLISIFPLLIHSFNPLSPVKQLLLTLGKVSKHEGGEGRKTVDEQVKSDES